MAFTPTQKTKVRAAITDFCVRAEADQQHWHYTQQRPFRYPMDPDGHPEYADCSAYVSIVFHYASHQTGLYLADPLGYRYTGWGYTGSQHAWLDANGKKIVNGQYWVGDMVIYGHTYAGSHTAVCRRNGSASTSVWSSNGNEGAPEAVKLSYHPDPILGVWRHPALL